MKDLTAAANRALYNLQAEFAVLPPDMQTGMSAVVNDILDEFARWISDAEATGEIAHVCHPRTQACILFSIAEHGQQLRRVLTDVSVTDMVSCWYTSLLTRNHAEQSPLMDAK